VKKILIFNLVGQSGGLGMDKGSVVGQGKKTWLFQGF
jgi:hypothetical protein